MRLKRDYSRGFKAEMFMLTLSFTPIGRAYGEGYFGLEQRYAPTAVFKHIPIVGRLCIPMLKRARSQIPQFLLENTRKEILTRENQLI